ncbi:riboflavin transporter FmnP [Mycetocola sp. BIGb0189]|uniref:hypothetical protein n=1 Tax=Mycetocola sp. BIGb0189 TaxID=2940604 RepID=UPI002169355C|nr:hypothetical protein [Mycetocola sp. BIGb0189]MCS4276110.1 riboflavin transporter FmnP [Mycetocola sp. BIGb0189]
MTTTQSREKSPADERGTGTLVSVFGLGVFLSALIYFATTSTAPETSVGPIVNTVLIVIGVLLVLSAFWKRLSTGNRVASAVLGLALILLPLLVNLGERSAEWTMHVLGFLAITGIAFGAIIGVISYISMIRAPKSR